MPWRLNEEEEQWFWREEDVELGGDLGLGQPPPGIRLQEVGWRLPRTRGWEPTREGSPLPPLEPGPMEVDGGEQAPEDGSTAGEAEEEDS